MHHLTPETVRVVKATAPAVAGHATDIVALMYRKMFAGNPEVADYFNPAHMSIDGQIGALAEAVAGYAENIDRLEVLGPAVERIAQKHVALQIRPEHYPIVGRHLLAAVREVLGNAVTPGVERAWQEAYTFLAGVFIGRERELYAEKAASAGGWDGLRPFRVAAKVRESETVTSLRLRPADGGAVPWYQPGQYVTLHFAGLGGAGTWRNYSLSDRPGLDTLRVSVKREPAAGPTHAPGLVSNHLHDEAGVGDELRVVAPCGAFVLREPVDRPVVLASVGVGATPLLSMWNHLAAVGCRQSVYYFHGAADSRTHAFRSEVDAVCASRTNFRRHIRYSRPAGASLAGEHYDAVGRLDAVAVLTAGVPPEADFYLCGPRSFLAQMHAGLVAGGVPRENIRYESFGPQVAISS